MIKTLTSVQKKAVEDQKRVISNCIEQLLEEDETVLSGGAGFGKSYCTGKIVQGVAQNNDSVMITTLSHKALNVASQFMSNIDLDYECYTNAAATHAVKNTDPDGVDYFEPEEKYRYVKGKKVIIPPPISAADIIVWDECSQASKKTLELVRNIKKPNAKILFVGDMAQLPPVGSDKISPVFTENTVHELKYPFRYEGENAEAANYLRSEILKGLSGQKYNPYCWRDLISMRYNDYRFFNSNNNSDRYLFNDLMLQHFKENEVETKYVAYHNWHYQKVAKYIRSKLHNKRYDWEVGDRIMAKSNHYDAKGILKIQNSQEGTITGKRKLTLAIIWINEHHDYRFMTIHPEKYQSIPKLKSYYAQTFNVRVSDVKVQEIDYWSHDVDDTKFIPTKTFNPDILKNIKNEIFQKGIHGLSPCMHKGEALSMVRNFFCDIQYSYALTSHTAQGSTYDNVFSSLADIYKNKHTSDMEKLQATYVATTRARYKNFILY